MADEMTLKGERNTVVDERWDKAIAEIRWPIQCYWQNTAFWLGQQWAYWSTTENAIRRVEPDPKRPRVTRNRIRRNMRVNMGKVLRNPLGFEVLPDAADDAAVRGAQLGQTTLNDTSRRQNWENVRSDETLTAMLSGTSAVCIEWDPAGYKNLGVTEEGRAFGEGDVYLGSLSIIEFVVQPGAKDGEFAAWWIKQTAEDPKLVKERYNLDYTPDPDATTSINAFETRILDGTYGYTGMTRSYTGRCLVRTMFERPCREHPKGRIVTAVDGKVVEEKDWYFPFKDRLNLVIFRDMKVDGRWTGESIVNDAVPIQSEINLARSILMDHLKKAGNARLFIPDSSMDEEDLTDDPGQAVFYAPANGAKPEWASPPPLPQWEVDYAEQAALEMDDVLGVHDISRGEAPKGVEAAAALSLLAERDDTPLGVFSRDQAEGWGRVGSLVLKLYEQRIVQPRKVTVSPENPNGGPALRPYSTNFTGDMLHGQTTATVPLEVMAPRSRAVMQAQADSLLQMGALGAPPDMRLYARIAGLPNKDLLLSALNADAERAQRENEQMFREQMAEPRGFDNHGVHIAEHNAARKAERYERSSASVQQMFDLHIQAHETMAAEEAARQQMKATEDPMLAAAAQGDQPIGSQVPVPVQDQLAAQGQMPVEAMPAPGPEAYPPPPPPELPPEGGETA